MNKKTIKLISDLNSTYDLLWKSRSSLKLNDISIDEYSSKLKLIKIITKNITEQSRGFLKSKLDYHKAGSHILENIGSDYNSLHKGVSKLLLDI